MIDGKIKQVAFRQEVNHELVEMLRRALELAERGQVSSGGVFLSYRNGDAFTAFEMNGDGIFDVGSAERLVHRMHQALDTVTVDHPDG